MAWPRRPPCAEADWSATGACFTSGATVGLTCELGLYSGGRYPGIDNLTLESDRDDNGSEGFETVEPIESFTLDSGGYAPQGPAHDAAGNLTYDGVYAYSYDAWNRLVKVTRAYRVSSDDGPPGGGVTLDDIQYGSVVQESEYDGLSRRIVRQVKNSGPLDCTYHLYYDPASWRLIEERNGSGWVIRQTLHAPLFGGVFQSLYELIA